jgi:hypothetical protein
MQFNAVDLLNQWETAGVFDYLLPFLLIFAVVFGILETTKVLGEHKGIHTIVALVIGLFTMRYFQVGEFIGVIFANFGIALSVILVLIILTGLFVTRKSREGWALNTSKISLLAVVIVVIASINEFAWFGSYWWQNNWVSLLWIAIIIGAIIAIMGGKSDSSRGDTKSGFGALVPLRGS